MAKYTCPTCHTEEVSILVYIPFSVTWSAWVTQDTGEVFDGEFDSYHPGTPSQELEEVVARCVECDTSFHAELERDKNGFPAKVLSLTPMPR